MRTAETGMAALYAALSRAQGALADPRQTRTARIESRKGRAFSYSYASLGDFVGQVRAVLAAEGLAITQGISGATLVTRLAHAEGGWIETDYPLRLADDPREQGSALTYARRYALQAALGLAAVDDDDDGARAAAAPPRREAPRREAPPRREQPEQEVGWTAAQRRAFFARVRALGWANYEELCEFLEFLDRPRPSKMTEERRQRLLAWLHDGAAAATERWLDSRRSPGED